MRTKYMNLINRFRKDEAGITALETAIILIAFVVVASVFAFTMLSAGTFSTERGKEAIYSGLTEVQTSMEIKGGVIVKATASTTSTAGIVSDVIFTLANAVGGQPVNLTTGADSVVVVEYRDSTQRVPIDTWTVNWLAGNDNGLLEAEELAEITIPLTGVLGTALSVNTAFVIEIKPPSGAVLTFQRTTPAWLETVNDLK